MTSSHSILWLAIVLGWTGTAAAANDVDAALPESVAARVGEQPISHAQLAAALRRNGVAALPAGPQRLQGEAEAIEQLIDEALLGKVIEREQITIDPAEVDAAVARLRDQVSARGMDFAAFLAKQARDEQGLRDQIVLELGIQKFVRPRLTPDALAASFEKGRRELDGTQLRVSHILLRPDLGRGDRAAEECIERAAAIRREILQGGLSFEDAARKHSAAPSRHRGGELGFLPRRSVANEEFARQAFALAKGDISKPFATTFGVHVVKVTGMEPGKLTAEGLRPQLEQMVGNDIVRDTVAQARRASRIEYAAGVSHFDPATPADGREPRRIIVAGAAPSP
jgi:parvulin-like peptidyl-prolyl isomerase